MGSLDRDGHDHRHHQQSKVWGQEPGPEWYPGRHLHRDGAWRRPLIREHVEQHHHPRHRSGCGQTPERGHERMIQLVPGKHSDGARKPTRANRAWKGSLHLFRLPGTRRSRRRRLAALPRVYGGKCHPGTDATRREYTAILASRSPHPCVDFRGSLHRLPRNLNISPRGLNTPPGGLHTSPRDLASLSAALARSPRGVEMISASLASIAAGLQQRPATWKRVANELASAFFDPCIVFRDAKTLHRDPCNACRLAMTSRRVDHTWCCEDVTCACFARTRERLERTR